MTTRRWLTKDGAIQYAIGCREEVDVMVSPNGDHWCVIHPYGNSLWREHGYRVAAMVRLRIEVYDLEVLNEA